MNIQEIVVELRNETERLDRAIAALEQQSWAAARSLERLSRGTKLTFIAQQRYFTTGRSA
jgi:hypothetical protein